MCCIEREPGRRIDRVHAVLLVDGLAKHQTPTSLALFEEVIETAGADNVYENIVHAGALRDRHLGLRYGPAVGDVDRAAAEGVQDADALLEALAANANEPIRRALEPGCHHAPIRMPHGAEALPVACVAPEHPIFHEFPDRLAFQRVAAHCWP